MATCLAMPRLSLTMIDATVIRWLKQEGEEVTRGEGLVEVQADKATVEVESPADGTLLRVCLEPGSSAQAGVPLAWIGQPGEGVGPNPPAPFPAREGGALSPPRFGEGQGVGSESPGPAREDGVGATGGRPAPPRRASPVARRLAAQHGLDLTGVVGTGPGGAVVEADIRRALAEREASAAAGPVAPPEALAPVLPPPSPAPVSTPPPVPAADDEEVIPLTGVHRIMAERVALSRRTLADVTTVAEVDMTEVRSLRARVPASYTAYVGAAVVAGLADFPLANSSFVEDHIVRKKRVHLGVAVATSQGLLVPVVRDAAGKSLRQIHAEIEALAERGRAGKLSLEDLSGATFTVTNSGVFGSLLFTPVIDPPQAATLGMGKVMATPVVRDGQIVARDIMYLCLSYDHRVLDGATAVRFLQKVKGYLEDPIALLWKLPLDGG